MIAWGLETLVASTLLMLLVLALRGPVRRAVGPGLAYALWLLPVLRLLLPPLPGAWSLSQLIEPMTREATEAPSVTFGVLNADTMPPEATRTAVVQTHVEFAGHAANVALVPPTSVANGPGLAVLILGFWAVGVLLFLAYHLIAHTRFCHRLTRRARVSKLVAGGKVRLIETDATQGPLAFGIWRKYVAFPRDFRERYDAVERDLALAHELGHHVRGDLVANWVALVVLAIHWFNPIAWRAFRAFRADQEMACDALVLAGRAPRLRHAYGRAIVKSAHGGAVSAACHLHTINDIKGRLRMLTTTRRATRGQLLAGFAGIGTLTLASLALTASGSQAAERLKSRVESSIGVDLADLRAEAPAPQTASVPPSAATPASAPAPAAAQLPPAPLSAEAVHDADEQVTEREWTDQDGKRHVERIVRREKVKDKDAKVVKDEHHVERRVMRFTIPEKEVAIELKDIPEISDGKCGTDEAHKSEFVIRSQEGDKRKMVICVDRIEANAKAAEAMAMRHNAEWSKMNEKFAMQSALIGLRMARRSIENQPSMTAEQRGEALKGIDQALAELAKDGAKDRAGDDDKD